MTIENTFNGAKSSLILFHAYINSVAEEIGMQQALALDTKTCQALGTAQGMMVKEQAGAEEFDLKTAEKLLSEMIEESFGITTEVVEENQDMITCKVGRCPIYEAGEMLGMDNNAIEAICRAGAIAFMDSAAKQLNPNTSYKLTKFRSSADDCCEEAVVMDE